ncbi:MAG: hypothetical protein A2589_00710 [Candidatus Vogelbacteria bacterium RIFOXYD1_FULL_46_19]|uniref:Uncharacterized protein n=1 Tax=Candidatus Vogelbacteria bacterium RIFOXYD1_FULL_46_19 TaxID=1802439 RepID=A0A1G2QJL2_9BACT|nr:MAG: hypothetical protein A2589_00710 [Candidatus Vogelbacteria bacterium RIFOXYD1_FULL_46_19]
MSFFKVLLIVAWVSLVTVAGGEDETPTGVLSGVVIEGQVEIRENPHAVPTEEFVEACRKEMPVGSRFWQGKTYLRYSGRQIDFEIDHPPFEGLPAGKADRRPVVKLVEAMDLPTPANFRRPADWFGWQTAAGEVILKFGGCLETFELNLLRVVREEGEDWQSESVYTMGFNRDQLMGTTIRVGKLPHQEDLTPLMAKLEELGVVEPLAQ